MRIATETCHCCGSPVFEEDIESGTALDELNRCICPRCLPRYRKPPVRRQPRFPILLTVPLKTRTRMIVLAAAALFLALLLTYLKTGEKTEARQPENDTDFAQESGPFPSPGLSPGYIARLEQAVRQYRTHRADLNDRIYNETRDRAIELMLENKFGEAVAVIERYPTELRNGTTWEMRLKPLRREAAKLSQAAGEYSRTLASARSLLEKHDYDGAVTFLERYAASFPGTEWANESAKRAARIHSLQKEREKPPSPSISGPVQPAPPLPEPPVQVPPEPEPPKPEPKKIPEKDEFKEKIEKAIVRGTAYLKQLRKQDGSFSSRYYGSYPAGPSALALLALLKCGEDRDSEIIKNGFKYLSKKPLRRTYSVSLYMLALAARFEPHGEEINPRVPFDTQLKKAFSRYATKAEKQKVNSIISWLRDTQLANGMWTYTGISTSASPVSSASVVRRRTGGGDGSNTQFAVFALYGAHRLGAAVPKETVSMLANTYLKCQRRSGTRVKSFPVPAADMQIQKLRREEQKALSRKEGPHTVNLDELYGGTTGRHSMNAKGWGYSGDQRGGTSISMTCAGVCNMVLAKAVLERTSGYARSQDKIDQSIRDGAAYISRYFPNLSRYMRGPGANGWGLYYLLYSIERAGMLTLCEKFGKHHWYSKGAKVLLKLQKPDGSWGGLEDTCFALLFLSRSTTPFIRASGTIYTGSDLFPRKNK